MFESFLMSLGITLIVGCIIGILFIKFKEDE